MALDLSKLENVGTSSGKTTARCPACAEVRSDTTGNHLYVFADGRFGCRVNEGEEGHPHRSRIFQLVGIRDSKESHQSELRGKWQTLDDASASFSRKLGTEIRRDIYRNLDGQEHFAVIRFDSSSGKQYRPFHRNCTGWIAADPPGPLPLFNLPDLVARSGEPVYVTEGEKAACALTLLGVLATTSAHGAKSANKSDWTPLKGRQVVILRDNDPEGIKYADRVAEIVTALMPPGDVRVVLLPSLPPKGDVVEWLAQQSGTPEEQRWALEEVVKKVASSVPAEPIPDPDAVALRARFFELGQKKSSSSERRKEMAEELIEVMHKRGQFFYDFEIRDHKTALFFDTKRKLLLRLSDPTFLSWLARFTAVNRTESDFSFLLAAIQDEALEGKTRGIIPELFWASRPGVIYISNGDGGIVRIAAGKVELVDNGTDGVLFAAGDTLPKWDLCEARDPFDCALFRDANFQTEHGLDLLRLWAMSLPANLGCKPPLTVTGQIRSGKTMLIRGLFWLYGLPERACEPTQTEEGKRDFWISVNGGGLYCLDNVDSDVRWLADAVATASTGGGIERKMNYEDTKRINLRARASLAITSANPTFAGDSGLADRLLLIRMGMRPNTASESELLDEVLLRRDSGLSFIAQKLCEALADTGDVPKHLNKRHPDFAILAARIGRALGREAQTIAALSDAEKDKPRFCLENEPLGVGILQLMTLTSFTGTAADLLESLRQFEPATFGPRWTPKGIGKRLSRLWPHLMELFQCEVFDRQGTKQYQIKGK